MSSPTITPLELDTEQAPTRGIPLFTVPTLPSTPSVSSSYLRSSGDESLWVRNPLLVTETKEPIIS